MATFDDAGVGTSTGGTTPSYGARKTSAPRVSIVNLGDGYSHRSTTGLNSQINPKEWSLKWDITETDSDKIETFFENNIATYFYWSPPAGVSGKYVCTNWSKSIPFQNRATIVATFTQVFDIG